MKKKSFIIVGGGVVGLLSALYLLKQGHHVSLVENSNKTGGLLGTAHQWEGLNFDYGTHFISSTGIKWIDNFLFSEQQLVANNWLEVPVIKAGNYFSGKLNEASPSLNLSDLPKQTYQKTCFELLHLKEPQQNYFNLAEQITHTMGETAAKEVFKPIMDKLYSEELDTLSTNAHHLFSLSRIILGSTFITDQLKQSVFFDDIVSYQERTKGVSALKTYYPSQGAGAWINAIMGKLEKYENFELLLSTQVEKIFSASDSVRVKFSHEQQLHEVDKLVWTVPLALLAKPLGVSLPAPAKPKMRSVDLYHFVFSEPFQTDLHYLYNYDSQYSSFRITLYSNVLNQEPTNHSVHHCSVEVLRSSDINLAIHIEEIKQELQGMGIIENVETCIHQSQQFIPVGFPVQTLDFKKATNENNAFLGDLGENIIAVGRGAGKSFFMKDVIVEALEQMRELTHATNKAKPPKEIEEAI